MKLVYSPRYHIDIGPHVFPTAKYHLVSASLLAAGVVQRPDLVEPEAASWTDLALVHTDEYLRKVRLGDLSPAEVAQLELPWSGAMIEGFRLMTGGTLAAARLAVRDGLGAHVGGGFHHAFANHGEGFCVFNDVAVAVRMLQRDGLARRAVVIDCDVHHGNGTAAIFDADSSVVTFSMHQQDNYPAFKPRSTLDIGLPDGIGDSEYLRKLEDALPVAMGGGADVAFYLAGADPYEDDQLGGLALTQAGLRERDKLVLRASHAAGVPVVVLLAGGYARTLDDTVAIHTATIEEAKALTP